MSHIQLTSSFISLMNERIILICIKKVISNKIASQKCCEGILDYGVRLSFITTLTRSITMIDAVNDLLSWISMGVHMLYGEERTCLYHSSSSKCVASPAKALINRLRYYRMTILISMSSPITE
jgi:hypothetical protein